MTNVNRSPILTLENISYHHATQKLGLDRISLSFNANEKTIILGPNGAGKSLLLHICHGLINPSSGVISTHYQGTPSHPQAMVFSRPTPLRRTVLENITYILKLRGASNVEEKAHEVLHKFDMTGLAPENARTLSTGEQQRLAFICAMIFEPEILFLDEPSSNLDPQATLKLEKMIIDAPQTIIMASHDLAQAQRLADQIIYIEQGKIIEQTPAEAFFRNPKTDQARHFISHHIIQQSTRQDD